MLPIPGFVRLIAGGGAIPPWFCLLSKAIFCRLSGASASKTMILLLAKHPATPRDIQIVLTT